MKTYKCINCDKEQPVKRNCSNKYCDNKCQQEYQSSQRITKWLEEGNYFYKNKQTPEWIREYIRNRDGECVECGISSWQGQKLLLEVDHIDGDYLNNNVDNLRALCPNCHSMTETFKGRNRGNGRTLKLG